MGRILDCDGDAEGGMDRLQSGKTASDNRTELNNKEKDDRLSAETLESSPLPENTGDKSDGPLRLDHFLKLCGAAMTGGHAKLMIQSGEVIVDGEIETRRRRKLHAGQQVEIDGNIYDVTQ